MASDLALDAIVLTIRWAFALLALASAGAFACTLVLVCGLVFGSI